MPFDAEPPLDPEPADPELPDPEPLDPELPDPEPEPVDPDPLPELSADVSWWCLWCLWCMASIVGDGLLAGLLRVADGAGAGLLAFGAWAALDALPQAVTRPRIPVASTNRSFLACIG